MGVSFLVASANVCIYIPRGFTTAGRQLLYTQGSTPMHALFLLGAGQKHTRYLSSLKKEGAERGVGTICRRGRLSSRCLNGQMKEGYQPHIYLPRAW